MGAVSSSEDMTPGEDGAPAPEHLVTLLGLEEAELDPSRDTGPAQQALLRQYSLQSDSQPHHSYICYDPLITASLTIVNHERRYYLSIRRQSPDIIFMNMFP